MRRRQKKKKRIGLTIFLCLLVLVILAALAIVGYQWLKENRKTSAPPPEAVYEKFMGSISPASPESVQWKQLFDTAQAQYRYEAGTAKELSYTEAVMPFSLTYLDPDKLSQGLLDEAKALLTQEAEAASRPDEIYDADLHYKEDILDRVFDTALTERLEQAEDCLSSVQLELRFCFEKDHWELENGDELKALLSDSSVFWDGYARSLREELAETAEYIPIRYKIVETALVGPEPDRSLFGSTDDPAVIEKLLASPQAQSLIGEETVAWNAGIELLHGSVIRYYLDETILSLVWQEATAQAVGTYSETFIADGSQLRRRIAGDRYEDFHFETTSAFAEKTNAVLALGGDFYHHGRACGIVVYNREIYRFEPNTCDTCFITSSGDMLLTYRRQFSTREEAQTFIDENDVLFSLCFGPVIIDNGVDVLPENYSWGEINDLYARSILGMFGEGHYLTLNVNCQMPDYYYLVTLRQAEDAVIEKGCYKAYTLDGGQTATTVFNNELINPVQFGWEKEISDIIYFATAIPTS